MEVCRPKLAGWGQNADYRSNRSGTEQRQPLMESWIWYRCSWQRMDIRRPLSKGKGRWRENGFESTKLTNSLTLCDSCLGSFWSRPLWVCCIYSAMCFFLKAVVAVDMSWQKCHQHQSKSSVGWPQSQTQLMSHNQISTSNLFLHHPLVPYWLTGDVSPTIQW